MGLNDWGLFSGDYAFLQDQNPTKNDIFSPKWGKIDPPSVVFSFFVYFSPVNSPDRWAWMPGDYYHVIMPFYRTKNDVFWPKIW